MIKIENLSVTYKNNQVLRDISLHVSQGEFVLLTGPSGCGKTTLARAICGLIPHSLPAQVRGKVLVAGLDTQYHPLPELAQNVNMVFQNPGDQIFHIRVQDEIAFGPRNLGMNPAKIQENIGWALRVTGLDHLRDTKVRELSGGQIQCLAIAATLAMRPDILVLDEPTASLDIPNSCRVIDTLTKLHKEHGITILIIEHRLAALSHKVDRILIMENGEIISGGKPDQFLKDRQIRQTLGLRRLADQTSEAWPALIKPNVAQKDLQDPLLVLDQVSAGYHRKPVIQQIDLNIYPGDFIGLIGDNGSGKSTLARVAAGLIKPLSGRVHFLNGRHPKPGLDVSILFQNPAEQLFTDCVEDEVRFGPYNYRCFDPGFNQEVLLETDLYEIRHQNPLTLSVGQQQRTALAACLALHPRLIILDEPTLGQDWGHLEQMMNFLTRLNQTGMAILLISHDHKLVHRYARRVLSMERGRLMVQGKGITNQTKHLKGYNFELLNT